MSDEWEGEDLLFRQVHPNHWDGANPNSVAFFPTPKDDKKLSVDDASMVSADQSWRHFTDNLGFKSVGTWAVSVEEITSAGDLELVDNPITDMADSKLDNPAHCLIDFSKVSTKGQMKKRAQELAMKASARGCRFPAP